MTMHRAINQLTTTQKSLIVLAAEEVQFNFKRGGATPKPPLTEKSLFDVEEDEEPFFNRTAEAQNQGIVFFNRVPKTGSEMFQVRILHAWVDR